MGGPATAQLGWLDTFLEASVAANCTPEFLSSHLYPTDPQINQTRNGFAQAIEGAVGLIQSTAAGLGILAPPLLITEFNCGLGINCADAPYAASFVAHQALMAQKTTSSIVFESYWTFSDIFEEQGQQPSEFSQAFGVQSIHGIPKPVYRSMQLLRQLLPDSLPVSMDGHPWTPGSGSVDIIATTSSEKKDYQILLSNHPGGPSKQPEKQMSLHELNQRLQEGWQQSNGSVSITLSVRGAAPHSVSCQRVDSINSNALQLYSALGRPPYPNATTIAHLQMASMLQMKPLNVSSGKDYWQVTVTMPPYSVALISFSL